MVVFSDPLLDFQKIIKDKWNTTSGGVKPTIEIAQDVRYIPVNLGQDWIVLNSLDEPDDFFGIGARDFRRDISINVIVRTNLSRVRVRQMANECRRIFRDYLNWKIYDSTGLIWQYEYINVKLSKVVDNSDMLKKMWWYTFDISTFRVEPHDST